MPRASRGVALPACPPRECERARRLGSVDVALGARVLAAGSCRVRHRAGALRRRVPRARVLQRRPRLFGAAKAGRSDDGRCPRRPHRDRARPSRGARPLEGEHRGRALVLPLRIPVALGNASPMASTVPARARLRARAKDTAPVIERPVGLPLVSTRGNAHNKRVRAGFDSRRLHSEALKPRPAGTCLFLEHGQATLCAYSARHAQ
jgi:hypothetical protein